MLADALFYSSGGGGGADVFGGRRTCAGGRSVRSLFAGARETVIRALSCRGSSQRTVRYAYLQCLSAVRGSGVLRLMGLAWRGTAARLLDAV